MPNFLIIGAAKAGTTALYDSLEQHPQIYMSAVKEPNFFALEGEELNFAKNSVKAGYLADCMTDIALYHQQFQGVSNEIAIGEASPIYLYHPKAPERIKHYIPNIKLVTILRDPIERAYSNFMHHVQDDLEHSTDFIKGIEEEESRVRDNWWWGFYYTRAGFYYEQLKRYFDRFERSQIKVYLYEDLTTNDLGILRDIFQFLGVTETFVPDMSIRRSTTGIPRNRVLHTFLRDANPIKTMFKPFLPTQLRKRFVADLKNQNLIKPKLQPEIRKQLIPIFQADILKLQTLIQRDLSQWLQ
jgi:hypothetical protein